MTPDATPLEFEHFPNAPIQEAVLEFRCEFLNDISIEALEAYQKPISSDYPSRKTRYKVQADFSFDPKHSVPSPKQSSSTHPYGYRFESKDKKQHVEARLDGFSFVQNRPYESWAKFRLEAERLWEIFSNLFRPSSILRIGLRYINVIHIPFQESIALSEFLSSAPGIATTHQKSSLGGYSMQMFLEFPDSDIKAIIMESINKPPPDSKDIALLFDIDTFNSHSADSWVSNPWDTAENLHKAKNDIFFSNLTDKAKNLFRNS